MNDTILFVDDQPELLTLFEHSLGSRYHVVTALGVEEALRLAEERGPFAVVVSDQDMPGKKGLDLFSQLRVTHPDTVGIMLTAIVDLHVAMRALHEGRILRFIEKPCSIATLCSALDDALAHHQRRMLARQRELELEFKHGALSDFNACLSERIQEQTVALHALNRFVSDLHSADALEGIADLAANAVVGVLGGRACSVELGGCIQLGPRVFAAAGGALSSRRHVEELVTQEGPLGMLQIDALDEHGRPMTACERDLVSSIAASTAVAVHNQIRRAERDEAQQATILALARLAEQRDNETGKHLERVSLYCRLIAEGLREDGQYTQVLTDEWIRDLVRSAPLHDIGKVGIPDAILLKPAKLTPEEWVIMKRHTEIGAQTLRSVILENKNQRFLQMSLDIAWCHHEKWDGGGYPRGLAGEEIPLAARILALADVYDALTSVRPYKGAWSHDKAVEWVVAGAGGHFDPAIVAAFVARSAQAEFIRARLADSAEDVARHERSKLGGPRLIA